MLFLPQRRLPQRWRRPCQGGECTLAGSSTSRGSQRWEGVIRARTLRSLMGGTMSSYTILMVLMVMVLVVERRNVFFVGDLSL